MSDKSLETLKLEHKRKLQYSLQIMATIFVISIAIIQADFGDPIIYDFIEIGLLLVLGIMGASSVKSTKTELMEIEEKVGQK